MKLRIGILFGGSSREREVSFAGGRTVYDNLDKALFEPVPLFVDSFGQIILLNWEYIYKGSIRDFYPPVDFLPDSINGFPVYAESIADSQDRNAKAMAEAIGVLLEPSQLSQHIDIAFLCLHGKNGEDGRLQGMLEWYGIPYTGSGILSSALGMNKAIQKKWMKQAGFDGPEFVICDRKQWHDDKQLQPLFEASISTVGKHIVIKPANQGSSIGVSILDDPTIEEFKSALDRAFFTSSISPAMWNAFSDIDKVKEVKQLSDIREGFGLPVKVGYKEDNLIQIDHPEELLLKLNDLASASDQMILIQSLDAESEVLIEAFISGKEFSCIVIRSEDGQAIALPPTEIRKGKELFDYRSKYLPGLSRKITPIDISNEWLNTIRTQCEKLFLDFGFNTYARIDGFITDKGEVFLNDPNTTSGMMPSSFFFHQAAEIGLDPSRFLTFIIRTSLEERRMDMRDHKTPSLFLSKLDEIMLEQRAHQNELIKIAVILGGYSSERHISVESGRNIYEKLSSSAKYQPIPIFLTGSKDEIILYQIPVNVLLKDNADDIKEKAEHYHVHPVVSDIVEKCKNITERYTGVSNVTVPKRIDITELSTICEGVFIALHGRPGEDGVIQKHLELSGLPYNGSGISSSAVTINKFQTNEILQQHGFLIPRHKLYSKSDWLTNRDNLLDQILTEFNFPFVAKPVDDGCSSAVRKVKSREELDAFLELIFRDSEELIPGPANFLKLKPKEEFPLKNEILVEEWVTKGEARHFLEITGGLLTSYAEDGSRKYEVFEPSETLVEGEVLSLEEKFLAGQGQNITPARYAKDAVEREKIAHLVIKELDKAAKVLDIEGYARIDAFVRVYSPEKIEVIFIEVNSLPGMTPATCIFHQCAINGYKPFEFINNILEYGFERRKRSLLNA